MRNLLLGLVLLVSFYNVAYTQSDPNTYSKVKIDLKDHPITEVSELGLETDHGLHRPGKYLINIFDQNELELLDGKGIPYTYVIKDVTAFYKKYGTMDENELELNSRSGECDPNGSDEYEYTTPENYEFGTMGGYLTYKEALENMDKMQAQYPNLITERMAIGDIKTHQGRSLYYMVISNTPNAVDPAKPQILYDALHHAREPNSLSNLLFYMWFLLENYGKDEEVTFLVDNTSMFFLPIINPDGYVFNEQIAPAGGGLWRKNRFPNSDGDTVGVDLNRNYGHTWDYDDVGSSPNEGSQTYRGIAEFSEPETQAVRALCNANNFQIALNYHTHGNLLIHPWGFTDMPTDEDVTFKSLGRVMTAHNDFIMGTGSETVGYIVNGDSDDWMYGEELEKSKIYSMTPEIGPSFWPGELRIDQLNKSTMRHNLNAAHLLLNFGWVKERFSVPLITAQTGTLFFEFEKSGLLNGLISLEVESLTPGVTLSNNLFPDLNMTIGETMPFQVDYEIEDTFMGEEIEFVVYIDNGNMRLPISFPKNYNESLTPDFVLYNGIDSLGDFENLNSQWNLTDLEYFSAPFSMTDSPGGNYGNDVQSELYIIDPLVTEGAEQAFIKFQTKFQIEEAFDYVILEVLTDDGVFTPLCGQLTRPAAQFSDGRPLYDGSQEWAPESICLNDYLWSEKLRFRFSFFSDGGLTMDGFYFDDLTFEVIGDDYISKTENLEQRIITVSPNPTNENIRISMHPQNFKKQLSYRIYNLSGTIVSEGDITSPQLFIDVNGYAQGSYFVQLIDNGSMISNTTFVKN